MLRPLGFTLVPLFLGRFVNSGCGSHEDVIEETLILNERNAGPDERTQLPELRAVG